MQKYNKWNDTHPVHSPVSLVQNLKIAGGRLEGLKSSSFLVLKMIRYMGFMMFLTHRLKELFSIEFSSLFHFIFEIFFYWLKSPDKNKNGVIYKIESVETWVGPGWAIIIRAWRVTEILSEKLCWETEAGTFVVFHGCFETAYWELRAASNCFKIIRRVV